MPNSPALIHLFTPNEAVHFLGDYHEILGKDYYACTRN